MPSAFPTTLPVRLDDQGRIDVDVSCPACGYNLRMQQVQNVCPECGQPLDVVPREEVDRLSEADTRWAAKVRRGVGFLNVGAWLMPLGVLPGLLVGVAGVWLITVKEPGRPEGWVERGTRLSARWPLLIALGCGAAFVGMLLLTQSKGWSWLSMMRRDATWLDVLLATGAASLVVGLLESWRVLFKLAARADGPDAARACRQMWKRYLIAAGVVVAVALATRLGDAWDLPFLHRHFMYVGGAIVAVVAAMVLWVWWGTVQLTKRLKSAMA